MVQSITAEDAKAAARQRLGLTRELEQARTVTSHPSKGGSRGYDVAWRQAELQRFLNGEPTMASQASIYRWRDRPVPYRMNGNKERETLVGRDLLAMAIYLKAYPCALADEVCMFVYNQTSSVYSYRGGRDPHWRLL